MLFQNNPPSFTSSLKTFPDSSLSHFVTYNREYYEWPCRLRCHIQVGMILVQGTWLGLVNQSVVWGSMWPTDQTSNTLVIKIRWWRFPLPTGPNLALPHPNSWLETHYVFWWKSFNMPSFNLVSFTGLCWLKLCRQYFCDLMEIFSS